MKAKIVLVTLVAVSAFVDTASAATFVFQTTSTKGMFWDGGGGNFVPDTSANFSFEIVTTTNDITLLNGTFTDGNQNPFGGAEVAHDLGATDISASDTTVDLINNDAVDLNISISNPYSALPTLTGTYAYAGGYGEQAFGSFTAIVTAVPLPSTAPAFGAALLALAGVRFGKRWAAVAARHRPVTSGG